MRIVICSQVNDESLEYHSYQTTIYACPIKSSTCNMVTRKEPPKTKESQSKGGRVRQAGKFLTDEINRQLTERDAAKTKQVARKLIKMATDGNATAIKEVLDRIEGKSVNTLAGDADRPITVVIKR